MPLSLPQYKVRKRRERKQGWHAIWWHNHSPFNFHRSQAKAVFFVFFQLKNDYEHHHHYPDVAPNYKRIFPVKNSEKFMSFQPLHLVCVLSSPFKSKLSSSSWFCFYLRLYPATLSDTKSENVRGGAKSLHFVIMIIFTCCKERYLIFVIIIITISLLSLVSCCHFHSVISQAHEKLFSAVC